MRFLNRQNFACRAFRSAAYRSFECLAVFDAHQIVKNRIDGGAEVIQTAAQNVEPFV